MVVAPRVVRRERPSLVVVRRVSDELLASGIRQRVDGAVEAEPRERLRLTPARAEAGTPEQPLCLSRPEGASICRDAGHLQVRLRRARILSA